MCNAGSGVHGVHGVRRVDFSVEFLGHVDGVFAHKRVSRYKLAVVHV